MKADVKQAAKSCAKTLERLIAIPSPTGFCKDVIDAIEAELRNAPLVMRRLAGGALCATWKGRKKGGERAVAVHADTIGLAVRDIKGNGRLAVHPIGGVIPFTVTGEYCTVRTLEGKCYGGTVLPAQTSLHIHKGLGTTPHKMEELEVRLDERVSNAKETADLGIGVGDLVLLDTRARITPSGFVKARHIDNKSGVAIVLALVDLLRKRKKEPAVTTHFLFAVTEETGFGAAAGLPPSLDELVVVDMGPVGPGQNATETGVSFCMIDGNGLFDRDLLARLIGLAEKRKIPFTRDVYPYYGCDRASYLRGGGDARVALMGPGVDASHAYERTHTDGLGHCIALLADYLTER